MYWSRGVEFELAGGKVQRVIAHSKGDRSSLRSAAEPGNGHFEAFQGELAGARIGLTSEELGARLKEPTQHLRAVPNGADPAGQATVYEYADHGLAIELDGGERLSVVRIHVPIAPARARPKP